MAAYAIRQCWVVGIGNVWATSLKYLLSISGSLQNMCPPLVCNVVHPLRRDNGTEAKRESPRFQAWQRGMCKGLCFRKMKVPANHSEEVISFLQILVSCPEEKFWLSFYCLRLQRESSKIMHEQMLCTLEMLNVYAAIFPTHFLSHKAFLMIFHLIFIFALRTEFSPFITFVKHMFSCFGYQKCHSIIWSFLKMLEMFFKNRDSPPTPTFLILTLLFLPWTSFLCLIPTHSSTLLHIAFGRVYYWKEAPKFSDCFWQSSLTLSHCCSKILVHFKNFWAYHPIEIFGNLFQVNDPVTILTRTIQLNFILFLWV